MVQPPYDGEAADLAKLRRQFPCFRIWTEAAGEQTRYLARSLQPDIHPESVAAADLAELRTALNGAHDVTSDAPQAIADAYPGWAVTENNGRWTATCPARTVHADSPEGLRAAIDRAIGTDHEG